MKIISFFVFVFLAAPALASNLNADMHAKNGADALIDWLEEYQAAVQEAQKQAQAEAQKTGKPPKPPKVSISEEKLNIAISELLLSLGEDSTRADVHINLGLAFEFKKSEEQALAEYETAIDLAKKGGELHFIGLFNKARLLGQMRKIPAALKVYQQALALSPQSNEIKTNIELLWMQGGGSGESDEQQDPQSGEDEKQQQPSDGDQDQKQQPQTKDLSDQDVKRILEEIKSQEQKIRAKEQELGGKERARDKDW